MNDDNEFETEEFEEMEMESPKFETNNKKFIVAALIIIGVLASNIGITGLPPTTLQGWLESAKRTTFNFFVPNKQVTKVTGGTLIETNNPDLLENSDFENSDVDHAWSVADVSINAESSDVVSGKQALRLVYIGDPVNLYQDSTINVTGFSDGVQGLLYLRVKNGSDKTLYACSRSAGTTSAVSNCATIPNTNKWIHAKLPVILGGTSNGIALTSNGEFTTGTIIVDDAFLGAQDVKQDVSTCADVNCETEFSAKVSSADAVSDENLDWIDGNCTDATTGDGTCNFNSGIFTLTPNCECTAVVNGVSTRNCHIVSQSSTSITYHTGSVTTDANYAVNLSCSKHSTDYTNAKARANGSVYSTAADSFSTDTHTLTHKATAITSTDPVGTYNTYSYAINSNTKTICGSAPTTAPTKADGFLIYTRAYNAASTCGNPARVEIKIAEAGTSLPTLSRELFKSAGKVTSGTMDYVISSASSFGAWINSYNHETGVLVVDAATQVSSNTASLFYYSDGSSQTSGYLVINAQKMKDSVVGSFKEVPTIPGVNKVIEFGATSTASCTASPCGVSILGSTILEVTRAGTGDYRAAIPAGKCSATPVCTASLSSFTANSNKCNLSGSSTTSTLVRVICTNSAGATTDDGFSFNCKCEAP